MYIQYIPILACQRLANKLWSIQKITDSSEVSNTCNLKINYEYLVQKKDPFIYSFVLILLSLLPIFLHLAINHSFVDRSQITVEIKQLGQIYQHLKLQRLSCAIRYYIKLQIVNPIKSCSSGSQHDVLRKDLLIPLGLSRCRVQIPA